MFIENLTHYIQALKTYRNKLSFTEQQHISLPSCSKASECTRSASLLYSDITSHGSLYWNCARYFVSRAGNIQNRKRKYARSAYLPFLCQSFLQIFYFGFISLDFSLELLLSLLKSGKALNSNKTSSVTGIKGNQTQQSLGLCCCFHSVSNRYKDSVSVTFCATPQIGIQTTQGNRVVYQPLLPTQAYYYHVLC